MIGIGTDIVKVNRVHELLDKYGERFPRRILVVREFLQFSRLTTGHTSFLARRFAAKEAVAKAMGTGIGRNVSFLDIEVAHNAAGRPEINFYGKAMAYQDCIGATKCYISIADEKDYAVAFAVLE